MSGARGRILVITYAFPPAAYVGVFRTLKYCKYLGEFGWDPCVLTVRPGPAAHRDDSLCAQIPSGVTVFRTFDLDPTNLIRAVSRLIRRRQPESREQSPGGSTATPQQPGSSERTSAVKRLLLEVLIES